MARRRKRQDKRPAAPGAVAASPTQPSPKPCCEKSKSDRFQPLPDYLQDEIHDVIAMAQFLGEPLWPYVTKAWLERRGQQLSRGAFMYYAYSPKRAEARRRHLAQLLRSPEILVAISPAGIIARLEKILSSALTPRVTGTKKLTYQEAADNYALRTRKVVTESVDHEAALAVIDRYLRIHALMRSSTALPPQAASLDQCTRSEALLADGVLRFAGPSDPELRSDDTRTLRQTPVSEQDALRLEEVGGSSAPSRRRASGGQGGDKPNAGEQGNTPPRVVLTRAEGARRVYSPTGETATQTNGAT